MRILSLCLGAFACFLTLPLVAQNLPSNPQPQWVLPAINAPQDGACRQFFGFSKSMVRNAVPMQQRGYDAVQRINEKLEHLGFAVHVMQEPVKDLDAYTKDPSPFLVTSKRIKDELESCRRKLSKNDTIIIYSHSHGLMSRPGQLGGIALDDPGVERPHQRDYLNWSEYAGELLNLPAKTVVVLTMACHSGGLVEYLNNDEKARRQWQARKEQGRNFLVITSQNARSLSNPRQIEGQIINPFTYAVVKAFAGEADGYQKGRAERHPDGTITLGELADFVVDETRKHTRANDQSNDPDPQVTGSFAADAVLAPLARTETKSSPPRTVSPAHEKQEWVTPAVQAPRVQHRTFDSAAAKTKVSYFIYTPEVYDTEKERRFPVLYWLHGTGGGLAGVRPLVAHFDAALSARSRIRLVIGDRDEMLAVVREFNTHLTQLNIPHTFAVLPGVTHEPMATLNALSEANWEFYRAAFGPMPDPKSRSEVTSRE